ncbi:hexokinase-1 [Xylariaceae sp. FL0804]|nr:hexokinase-1 [Xylariaceae sp. FL0804]
MQPLASAMATLRSSLLAALRSFLQGKSFLQALLAFWVSPQVIKDHRAASSSAVTEKKTPPPPPPLSSRRTVDDFVREAEELLLGPVDGPGGLRRFASALKAQFRERLAAHTECMLPSFNHLLPTGRETGRYLALDVGGSTLRVALVELRGRGAGAGRETDIVRMVSFRITPEVKRLEGMAFFDWMAARIHEVVREDAAQRSGPLPVGLAWSFPVEQTGMGSGLLLGMGKGFLATNGLLGQDLGAVITQACAARGLDVRVGAILNDGAATLLSQAYVHGGTRLGLILGTGANAAVHLPVAALGRAKYGAHRADPDWFRRARRVTVNTELGMFGYGDGGVLPLTRWDERLREAHPRPDFQPLEHLLSGLYLGEICRLAIVEAVEDAGLLGGQLPPSLAAPYSLDTELLSRMEADTTPSQTLALELFSAAHPHSPSSISSSSSPSDVRPTPTAITAADARAIRALASAIARRSAALLGASVAALWELRREAEAEFSSAATMAGGEEEEDEDEEDAEEGTAEEEASLRSTKVAFNGSVIERYPGYRAACQAYIDQLVAGSSSSSSGEGEGAEETVELVPALESSILGAAVALGCVAEP